MVSHLPLLLSLYSEESGVSWWTCRACSCFRLKGAFIDALSMRSYLDVDVGDQSPGGVIVPPFVVASRAQQISASLSAQRVNTGGCALETGSQSHSPPLSKKEPFGTVALSRHRRGWSTMQQAQVAWRSSILSTLIHP